MSIDKESYRSMYRLINNKGLIYWQNTRDETMLLTEDQMRD